MKCTCPMQTLAYPMRTIFHRLALGSRWVDRGSRWVDRGSHLVDRGSNWVDWGSCCVCQIGIPKAKSWRSVSKPTRGPNVNGFALQWNIGFRTSNVACQVLKTSHALPFMSTVLSIGPMSHVNFRKSSCRCVVFKGQGP